MFHHPSPLSHSPFPAAFRSGEIQTGKLRFRSQTAACVILLARTVVSSLHGRVPRSVSFCDTLITCQKRYHCVVLDHLNICDAFTIRLFALNLVEFLITCASIGTWLSLLSTLTPMSDGEDDYLSDKFLAQLEAASKPPQSKSYTERRKQALKQSQLLDERNRKKSRKQMELEAREEGLQTSLIQKAQEEAKESGKHNKALTIMMKMGFKPGQTLGETHENSSPSSISGNLENAQKIETSGNTGEHDAEAEALTPPSEPRISAFAAYKHRAEPLSIKEWSGKLRSSSPTIQSIPHTLLPPLSLWNTYATNLSLCTVIGKTGIGGVKRPPSPSALERAAKMAKQSENLSTDEFRDRARREYEDRRAEGRLRHARTTCVNLDAKADIKVRMGGNLLSWGSLSLVLPFLPSSTDSGLIQKIRNRSHRGCWRLWKNCCLPRP